MAPRKDTPEYEAWKNSPAYEEWKQKLSERRKERWKSDPEFRRNASVTSFHKGDIPHNKGKLLSDEGKAKISASLKGKPAWNKGVPMTEEQKAKLSAAKKGVKPTPEVVAKRAKGIKASYDNGTRILSEEGRQKMSATHKEKVVSAETREKQSLAKRGKPGNKDFRHTEESKLKMSQATHNQWERWTEEQRTAKLEILRAATKDITKSMLEEVIALELDAQGIVYERQKRIGWYRVDFYIPQQNLIIEAQGCFWHACEQCGEELHKEKRATDLKRHEYLLSKGYVLKIIWEHERQSELRVMRRAKGGIDGSG